MNRLLKFLSAAALGAVAIVTPLSATSITSSYTGTFTNDNDVLLVPITLLGSSLVTFQTFGYGGGVNAESSVILPGGFESMLQLFDQPGGAVNGSPYPGADPTCGPRNPDPNRLNFCLDAYGTALLGAGDYLLALTQSPNGTAGTNLSDGFIYDGTPDFNSGFVGTFGFQGDGHWALDVTVADVTVAGTPEPGTVLMVSSALLLVVLRKRKRAN